MERNIYQRFNVDIGIEEVKNRFINRVYNLIFGTYLDICKEYSGFHEFILRNVANKLGAKYVGGEIGYYVKNDFLNCLSALEAMYEALNQIGIFSNGLASPSSATHDFETFLQDILLQNEVDIGISWKGCIFTRTGAKLLDDNLVNEPLLWLSGPKYHNVLKPFQKGLQHYMEATKRPELLSDTVTDMYEALEALAKIVTPKPKRDLSANRELFVKELGLSKYYNKMLDDYISYACDYRHAPEPGKDRPIPSPKEVEAFVYTTGLFIRLVISE